MKHDLVIVVSKIHTIKHHVTLQFFISDSAVCLMRMFPCPDTGTHRGLRESSIRLLHCIYQRHITIIHLFRLIKQIKHTLSTGQCHNDRVELLRHLRDRHIEASGQLQEGCQTAKGQTADSGNSKDRSHTKSQHIVDISKVRHDRHQNICIGICIFCTVEQSVIKNIKILLGLLFMTEYLYNLLAFHHFLNITVQFTKIFLLFNKIFSTLRSDFTNCFQHNEDHYNDQQSQLRAQYDHGNKSADDRDGAAE